VGLLQGDIVKTRAGRRISGTETYLNSLLFLPSRSFHLYLVQVVPGSLVLCLVLYCTTATLFLQMIDLSLASSTTRNTIKHKAETVPGTTKSQEPCQQTCHYNASPFSEIKMNRCSLKNLLVRKRKNPIKNRSWMPLAF
jgi:hypothetical protein